ncbi:MAG: hypothetical protein RIQ93_3527 [Verrucomicrobiota bacterium]|jgi:hypothetical protein
MTKRLFHASLVFALVLSSGCLFSRKSGAPKESSSISGEVEANFKRRWVDRRTAELVAQRTPADAALAQATREFGEKYEFGRGSKP